MRIRQFFGAAALFLALLALLAGCGGPAEAQTTPAPAPAPAHFAAAVPTPTPEPIRLRLAGQSDHPALMTCDGSGAFFPDRAVTRAELCRALDGLLRGYTGEPAEFADFFPGNTGYAAAASLAAAGIVEADADGAFRPKQAVTLGETALILRRLGRSLPGKAGERALDLADETAGTTDPGGSDAPLTRAELARILVTLADRVPDETGEAALFLAETLPEDVAMGDYAWACIADAVTEGRVSRPAHGVHRAYGWLYAVWEDGTLIRDMDWGVWTFGPDGAYTTGIEALDESLKAALADSGANGLTGRAALKAAYLYVKRFGEYLVRPEDEDVLEPGAMGWEYERADRFFRYGGGTCYGYAAAFGLMARALGEEAYIVSAQVNQYYGAHAFVVIPEDGTDWVYDVELEDTRPERHGDLDLFRIEARGYYNYWYETDWQGVKW